MAVKKTQKKTKKVARTPKKEKKVQQSIPESVDFDYIKSNLFRVVRVDGAHGGVSPKGSIQLAFFSERQPIPQKETYAVERTGALGELRTELLDCKWVK